MVAIRLIAGRRMTASTARRQSGPSSPAEAATRRPSHGTRRRSTRSPRTIRIAGWNVSATTIETSADDDGAQAETAQGGVGHEQHRDHRQRERGAAEDDRARGGVGDGQDRLARAAAAVAFFAQARDDEQRVVDPEREAHRDDHVQDEQVELERLADDGGDAERDDDRDDRHQHRDRDADERADDEQQHDQRGGQPELQLALAQVARRELREVAIERVACR